MKRFAALALAVLTTFGFVAAANAQTAVAPLITQDTNAVVRVDLSQIDGAQLSQTTRKLTLAAIDYFVADEEQAEELQELAPLAGLFAAQYTELYVAPLKDAGVSELYVLVDKAADAENPTYPFIAIPIDDLSQEEVADVRDTLKTLNGQLDGALKYRFARFGFMIVPIIPDTVDDADAKAYVKARFSKIAKADDAVFAKGFAKLGTGAVVSGVNLPVPPSAEEQQAALDSLSALDSAGLFGDMPQNAFAEMLKQSAQVADLVQYNAWKIDLDALEVVGIAELKSAKDAPKHAEAIDDMLDTLTTFYGQLAATLAKEADLPQDKLDQTLDSLAAIVKAFTVDSKEQNGSTLTWTLDAKFFEDAKPLFDKLIADFQALQPQEEPQEESTDDEFDF